jgi:hypothetical protein
MAPCFRSIIVFQIPKSIVKFASSTENGPNLKVLEATDPDGSWAKQQGQDSRSDNRERKRPLIESIPSENFELRRKQFVCALDHAAACGDQQLEGHCPVRGSRWNRYVRIPRVAHFVDFACAALRLCRVLPERYAKANAGKHHKE